MKVFLLWHNDDRDYYVKQRPLLGVFTTEAKALEAMERVITSGEHTGPIAEKAPEFCELYFEIEEHEVQ